MDFLLISPPYSLGTRIMIPDGMASVTQFLKMKQNTVQQVDLFMKVREFNKNQSHKSNQIDLNKIEIDSVDSIEQILDENKYVELELRKIIKFLPLDKKPFLAFSIHSYSQMIYALFISKLLKKDLGNIQIIFGGAYFSTVDCNFLFSKFKWVDIITIGAIESTYDDLIINLNLRRRKIINKMLSPTTWFPTFDYSNLNLNSYQMNFKYVGFVKTLTVLTSSGCQFKCNFCNANNSNHFKLFSAEEIVSEIERLKSLHDVRMFRFVNQYVNITKNQMRELCTKIIDHKLNINWSSYGRIDNLDEDLIALMAKSGCVFLSLGLESASEKVLKLMNKQYSISKIKKIIPLFKKYKIAINVNLIVGYPGETVDGFNRTLLFVEQFGKYIRGIGVSYFTLLFNSNLYNPTIENKSKYNVSTLYKVIGMYYSAQTNNYNVMQHEILLKKIYKYSLRKEYPLLNLIPFVLFDWLYHKNNLYSILSIYRLFNKISNYIPLAQKIKK